MNRRTRIIFAALLTIWLIPQMGMVAVAKDMSTLGQSKIHDLPNEKKCLTENEEKNMVYAVIEEGLDTPDTAANEGTSGVRKCARYTEILQVVEKGDKKSKLIIEELLKECPEGLPDSGTDEHGQYFDCQEVSVIMVNPETGAIGLIQVYVGLIYRWAAGIVGVIAVLIIVVSGIQISTANGEPSVVEEASKRITQSLGGIAILFLASGFLYIINPTFFKAPDYAGAEQDEQCKSQTKKIYGEELNCKQLVEKKVQVEKECGDFSEDLEEYGKQRLSCAEIDAKDKAKAAEAEEKSIVDGASQQVKQD